MSKSIITYMAHAKIDCNIYDKCQNRFCHIWHMPKCNLKFMAHIKIDFDIYVIPLFVFFTLAIVERRLCYGYCWKIYIILSVDIIMSNFKPFRQSDHTNLAMLRTKRMPLGLPCAECILASRRTRCT